MGRKRVEVALAELQPWRDRARERWQDVRMREAIGSAKEARDSTTYGSAAEELRPEAPRAGGTMGKQPADRTEKREAWQMKESTIGLEIDARIATRAGELAARDALELNSLVERLLAQWIVARQTVRETPLTGDEFAQLEGLRAGLLALPASGVMTAGPPSDLDTRDQARINELEMWGSAGRPSRGQ